MKENPSGRPSEAVLRALGLPTDASRDQVQATRDDLAQLLESAPDSLHSWATSQLALADEALGAFGPAAAGTAAIATAAAAKGGTGATSHVATTTLGATDVPDDGIDLADVVEPDDLDAPPARGALRRSARKSPLSRKAWAWLTALVLIPLVLFGVYYLGDKSVPAGHPSASSTSLTDMGDSGTPTPIPVDPAKEKDLQAKVAQNPNDTDSMHQLAVMYFKANDMASAAKWDQEILKVKPDDEDAMLELGVTKYNTNDLTGAEDLWQKVVAKNPKNADAHFDLGFLYLNMDPPQMDKCEAEWQKVIDIDPSSDLAQYVSGYLGNHGSSASAKAATPTATKS